MTPLKVFYYFTTCLFYRPFEFWPVVEQNKILTSAKEAAEKLKKILEANNVTDNIAYKALCHLDTSISSTGFDEVIFIQSLNGLIDVYKISAAQQQRQFLNELEILTNKAKQKILEYHIGLESLATKAKNMSPIQLEQKDRETIQTIGIFYIMEYTVYLLSLLPTFKEEDRKKLFFEGLKTPEANLPSYTSFSESFRRDLCLKIFDPVLRHRLLKLFFDFEELYQTGDIKKICPAFKQLNLNLLKAFQTKGIMTFKTVLLSPFGKTVPMEEMIAKLEKIAL